jgi:hypothetical protein
VGQAPKSWGCEAGLDPPTGSQFRFGQAINFIPAETKRKITDIFAELLTLTISLDNDNMALGCPFLESRIFRTSS